METQEITMWKFSAKNLQDAITEEFGDEITKQINTGTLETMKGIMSKAQRHHIDLEESLDLVDKLTIEKRELGGKLQNLKDLLYKEEPFGYRDARLADRQRPKDTTERHWKALHDQYKDMKGYYNILCWRIGDIS